jgi:hypothetical protein
MEVWRLKMEPWRVYRLVVADPITLKRSRIQIRIRFKVKSWIRIGIGIKTMPIHNIDDYLNRNRSFN